jgi:hypothetical protein
MKGVIEMADDEMMKALLADGEKLRQLTGEDHGPFCPRCLVNPLGSKPVFLGADDEHICERCWLHDREKELGLWGPGHE